MKKKLPSYRHTSLPSVHKSFAGLWTARLVNFGAIESKLTWKLCAIRFLFCFHSTSVCRISATILRSGHACATTLVAELHA